MLFCSVTAYTFFEVMVLKKYKILTLVLILCCLAFAKLTYLSFERIDKMVSALGGERMPTIVLDAGHGGEDGGAVSKSGVVEKDINLAISLDLQKMLQLAGFPVVMIRESDVSVGDNTLDTVKARKTSDLHNRLKIVEEQGDCIFISIHQNHFTNSKYYGSQIFYSSSNPESAVLAQKTQETIAGLLQPDNKREIKPATNSIYLLWNAKVPAMIVECGFLSNESETKKLSRPDYQKQMAFAICQGFLRYWNSGTDPSPAPAEGGI